MDLKYTIVLKSQTEKSHFYFDFGAYMVHIAPWRKNNMQAQQIQKRFEELRRNRVFKSARSLAESMQIDRKSITRILNGDIRSERDRILFRAIVEKLGLNEDSFYGRVPMPAQRQHSEDDIPVEKVPLWGDIPAGNPTHQGGHETPEDMIEPPPGIRSRNVFALRVSGRSMYPRLIPGDTVFLEKLEFHLGIKDPARPVPKLTFERLDGRIVAVLLNGDATLKQLRIKSLEGKDNYELKLVPFNDEFQTITVQPSDEVVFQGVAIRTVRDETLATLNHQEALS
jgi:SOS-response transcriptional repressor LexA